MHEKITGQMLLFDEPTSELTLIWDELNRLRQSHDKTRRKLFKHVKDIQSNLFVRHKITEEFLENFKKNEIPHINIKRSSDISQCKSN